MFCVARDFKLDIMGGLSSRFYQHDDPYVGDMVMYTGDEVCWRFPMYHGPLEDGHIAGCEFCRLFFHMFGYTPMWICSNFVEDPYYHAGA